VEDYAAEGKSLARVDGKVVFIERVVPGDIVDVRLLKSKKDWAEGYPLQFHEYSKDRVQPFCSHFGVCGGCQWQMLPYEKQLLYKQKQVSDNLTRIGKVPLPEMMPILGAKETTLYRNKLEFTFSSKRFIPEAEFVKRKIQTEESKASSLGGELVPLQRDLEEVNEGGAGFHAKGMFDKIVEIEHCHLQAEPSNAIRKTITDFSRKNNYSFYDYKLHTGFLRTLLLRITTTGEVMVNLVMGEDDEAKRKPLLEHLMNEVPGITTLLYTVNTKFNDSLYDLNPVVVKGNGYVTETLEDFKFKISPKSFFQTNTKQKENLDRAERDFAELTGTESVYDLY